MLFDTTKGWLTPKKTGENTPKHQITPENTKKKSLKYKILEMKISNNTQLLVIVINIFINDTIITG